MATVRFAVPPAAFEPDKPVAPKATPAVSAVPAARPGRSWGRMALQFAPLGAVTFLAKVSVPPLGARGLGIDVPIILAATFAGLVAGALHVHPARLTMYLAMLAWLGGMQLFLGEPFSATSLVLLAALFLPLTMQLRPAEGGPLPAAAAAAADPPLLRSLGAMVSLATLFAACGLLQFVLQRWVGKAVAFPVEHLVPPAWLIQNFNAQIPVGPGEVQKANGVFFLEPSFFSQFMALGLLLELSLRNRLSRIVLLGAALAVSYSGTGLVVAALGLFGLVVVKGRWDLLLLGALLLLVHSLLGDASPLQPLLHRMGEFRSPHSSGSARFVAWIDMFAHQWWTDPVRVLFGAGAGSFAAHAALARQPTAEMSFAKMLFEYGVTGAVLFFGFLVYAFNSVRAPVAFRLGLCATLLVNGALVAFPVGIAASVLLWPAAAARRALATPTPMPAPPGAAPPPSAVHASGPGPEPRPQPAAERRRETAR
ncbi:MAG: hypothetical protein HZC37_00260 [Burkholderiales bacterium]|nr:hypothetical protein [Burkholderiales bacterium]